MKAGYARVSTTDQTLAAQRDSLAAAGCERIFEDDGVSGGTAERPGLDSLLAALGSGDVLVVARLDRLGRSLADLVALIDSLREKGVAFQSLQERIDTTSAGGRFYFHLLAALAEFERELIRERTRAGLESAKQRGTPVGRPRKLTHGMIEEAREAIANGTTSRAELARTWGVSKRTVERATE